MHISTILGINKINKRVQPYQIWGLTLIILVGVAAIFFLFHQKLQNDQVEIAQPDGSFVFEADLSALPTFGQTFVPRQAGLRGIYLPLNVVPGNHDEAALTLHLRTNPQGDNDIRTATLPLAALVGLNLARFSFEPLPDSFNTRYYFFLEPTLDPGDEAEIELRYSGPTAYTNGALYLDGEPQEYQANFFLAYDRTLMLLDWGRWLVKNGLNMLAIALLATLPGAALLVWLWPRSLSDVLNEKDRLNPIEWLALAAGLSVAIYPVLLLLAGLLGVRLGSSTIVAFLIVNGLTLIAGIRYHRPNQADLLPALTQKLFSPPILLFWLILVLSAAVRIAVVRGQAVPLWQDSYHHTMISQLIINNGGLFNAWAPYAPIESFSYHFGFHTFVAAYHWLTGNNTFQAVLATGQLLNLLTVLVAFLLGRRFGGSAWAGAFAALITGLLSEYPMFYVNWGRYTQLAGQVILPVAMVLTWLALKTPKPNYRLLGLTALSVASLALTHYRVVFFYPAFVVPLIGLRWLQADWQWRQLGGYGWRLAVIGLGSLLLVAPWLWRLVNGRLWRIGISLSAGAANNKYIDEVINAAPNLFDYVLPAFVILGIIGMLWGSWQKREGIVVTSGWGLMLFILARPHMLNLPGTGLITNFAVSIAAYLPISILAGYALAETAKKVSDTLMMAGWTIVLLAVGAGLMGAQARISSFEPRNAMVTNPDLAAMAWIRENTPPDAVFWGNTRLAYGDSAVVGTDAAWWIPLLAGRKNLVLPMIYGTEINRPVDYPRQILELSRHIQRHALDSLEGWQTLRQAGVTHIYVGQRRGEVWQGAEQPLKPDTLANSPYYQQLYQEDQVRIFLVKPSP